MSKSEDLQNAVRELNALRDKLRNLPPEKRLEMAEKLRPQLANLMQLQQRFENAKLLIRGRNARTGQRQDSPDIGTVAHELLAKSRVSMALESLSAAEKKQLGDAWVVGLLSVKKIGVISTPTLAQAVKTDLSKTSGVILMEEYKALEAADFAMGQLRFLGARAAQLVSKRTHLSFSASLEVLLQIQASLTQRLGAEPISVDASPFAQMEDLNCGWEIGTNLSELVAEFELALRWAAWVLK